MITPEIIDFIEKQLQAGVDQDKLKEFLVSQGFDEADINESFPLMNKSVVIKKDEPIFDIFNIKNIEKFFAILFILILLIGSTVGFSYIEKIGPFKKVFVVPSSSNNLFGFTNRKSSSNGELVNPVNTRSSTPKETCSKYFNICIDNSNGIWTELKNSNKDYDLLNQKEGVMLAFIYSNDLSFKGKGKVFTKVSFLGQD